MKRCLICKVSGETISVRPILPDKLFPASPFGVECCYSCFKRAENLLPKNRYPSMMEFFYIWSALWQYGDQAEELLRARTVILAETIFGTNR
jgi:hypothetical protein